MADASLALRPSPRGRDAAAGRIVWGIAILVTALFAWILFDLMRHGVGQLSLSFLTDSPSQAGREGGILPIIVSTLLIVLVCMVVALPIGLGTAVLLSEFCDAGSRFGRFVRRSLDALAAVPSIVFGLFGSAFFCIYLGMGFSILSGGLTLACMVLPIFIRTAEEGLRAIPDEYRQASAALGLDRTSSVFQERIKDSFPIGNRFARRFSRCNVDRI